MTVEATATDEPTPQDPDLQRRATANRRLRSQGNVVAYPGAEGVLAAVTYDAVKAGLSGVESFGGSAGQDDVPEIDKHVAALVEPRHSKVRRIVNSVVAFHKSQKIEPYLEELVNRQFDAMLVEARANGVDGVDLTKFLADPIPPSAMARLMGFPAEDALKYYEWMKLSGDRYADAARRGVSIAIGDANPFLSKYVDDQIAARQALPEDEWPNDALSRFLQTEVEGERLEARNIRAQILFMIGAGTDTTRNSIGNLFYRLGCDPEAYAALRADRSLIDAAVEEVLRIDAPAQFMVRGCRKDTVLVDTPVEEGQRVLMCIGSANHDDTVFDDADEFRLDRENRDHLAFGAGPHICPGSSLARLEIRTVLRTFLDRVRSFQLIDPVYHSRSSAMLQGPESLHILIDEVDAT